MTQTAVILKSDDNVATALDNLESGETLELKVGDRISLVRLVAKIPFGHKLSLSVIPEGSPVIKYGEVIGFSTANIKAGDHVHIHNVISARGRGDLEGGGA